MNDDTQAGTEERRTNMNTSINDMDRRYRENAILYRLAVALGYESKPSGDIRHPNLTIEADPEEVVAQAVLLIETAKREFGL